jgi:hypothetical protein
MVKKGENNMKCITRYEMNFGDIIIPERTECIIINKPNTYTVNAPGVQLNMVINNCDLKLPDKKNENKVIKFRNNVNNACLSGIYVHTNTQSVYMYADDNMYSDYGLYTWELEKIFGRESVPQNLIIGKYLYNGKDAKLIDVIDYLEEEFAEWVRENCEFMTITEENIDDYEFYEFEIGDTTLSDLGLKQFENKCLEYKKRLETTGFTYDFTGGLIWH